VAAKQVRYVSYGMEKGSTGTHWEQRHKNPYLKTGTGAICLSSSCQHLLLTQPALLLWLAVAYPLVCRGTVTSSEVSEAVCGVASYLPGRTIRADIRLGIHKIMDVRVELSVVQPQISITAPLYL